MLKSLVVGLALVVPAWASIGAQAQSQSNVGAGAPHVSLFTRDDAYLAAFFAGGTVALWPFDKRIAGELQEPSRQANHFFQSLSKGVRIIAIPGSTIIGTSMYIVGRVTHADHLADLGLHGEEAIGIADVLNTAIKWTAGRARPYAVSDTNPRDFQVMRGYRKGRKYSSFPSGHAMAAFAAAAVVSDETSEWWPHSEWYAGTLMFSGATAVGLSRLYNDQHWASDVIVGAAIGTFAGNKVVRFSHRTNPNNRLDHLLLTASIHHTEAGGLAMSWGLIPR